MGCTASKSDTVDSNEVKLVKAKGGDAEAASNGIESTPSAAEATENVFNKLWPEYEAKMKGTNLEGYLKGIRATDYLGQPEIVALSYLLRCDFHI